MTPLGSTYQNILYTDPHNIDIITAIAANQYVLECNNIAGWQTPNDDTVPLIEALIIDETQWLPFAVTAKIASIQANYNALIATGRTIVFGGNPYVYQLDETSRNNMVQAWAFGQIGVWPTPGFTWIDQNNLQYLMSKADFDVFCINVTTYYVASWLTRRNLIDAANACTTVAALDALNITTVWPANP